MNCSRAPFKSNNANNRQRPQFQNQNQSNRYNSNTANQYDNPSKFYPKQNTQWMRKNQLDKNGTRLRCTFHFANNFPESKVLKTLKKAIFTILISILQQI